MIVNIKIVNVIIRYLGIVLCFIGLCFGFLATRMFFTVVNWENGFLHFWFIAKSQCFRISY